MAKFTWQDGTLVSKAKVEIGGTIYEVDPEEYSGATPLSASNLNAMQDGIYDDINENTEKLNNLIKITEKGYVTTSQMTATDVGGHTGRIYNLTFEKTYSNPPMVIVSTRHDANVSSYGVVESGVHNITNTGCQLLFNADLNLDNYGINYIVIV